VPHKPLENSPPDRLKALLFIACWLAYAYFHQGGGWNQNARFAMVRAMAEQHTFAIDDYLIYTAAITPNGLACSGEIADGVFPIWMIPERSAGLVSDIEAGLARRAAPRSLRDFDIAPFVTCVLGDDLERCRVPVRAMLALYIGGMGAPGKNFYADYAMQLGYEAAAKQIQRLYLDGRKAEAAAAVPDELVDSIALIGSRARIAERVAACEESPATTLLVGTQQPEALRLLAELML